MLKNNEAQIYFRDKEAEKRLKPVAADLKILR
jgi:hypothetical protein